MMNRTLALLAALAFSAPAAALSATVTHIAATGNGSVAVTSDTATIRAALVSNADTATVATSTSNATYAKIAEAVAKTGVPRSDVTLAFYNINYNPRPLNLPAGAIPPNGPFGYIVTRTFDVKVKPADKAGAVIDALVGAGATNIENVTFSASETRAARNQAIADAVAAARADAEASAKAAGLHITGIERIEFSDVAVQPVRPMMAMARVSADTYPTTLDQGNVNVTATVTVIFLAQ
jgi:uncharacterized protein